MPRRAKERGLKVFQLLLKFKLLKCLKQTQTTARDIRKRRKRKRKMR